MKSLHIHLNPSQTVSPLLFLNGLVMVTNEDISNVSNKKRRRGINSNFICFANI